MFYYGQKQYRLARIGLVRAACPREIAAAGLNLRRDVAIRVDANTSAHGTVGALGYTPRGIVVAGAAMRTAMLELGRVHAYAFVEDGALDIRADDEISCNELMDKLRQALNDRVFGPGKETGMPGQAWPSILEIYPFENYFIFSLRGQKYRQSYFLDPVARVVRLNVGATKVDEKFVDASTETMNRVQTGVRYAVAPPKGNNQTSTTGARNSELVTQVIRNWKNVLEAVNMYLSAIRGGTHKPPMRAPMFAPVDLTPAGKIGTKLAAMGIDPYDFAVWSAKMQAAEAKTKDGLPASSFAYVGDRNDPSTLHLKIQDAGHVRNALARVNQVKGIPENAKAGVLGKLHKLAKHHGIDVTEKPTKKQQAWKKKGKEKYAA